MDRNGQPCCGFGFKLFHRRSGACELDVLVLAATSAPFMHGETLLWPPWGLLLAAPWHALSAAGLLAAAAITELLRPQHDRADDSYYVIPEDLWRKSLMADDARWCQPGGGHAAWEAWSWCGGPPLSFFHAEYFAPGELFPTRTVSFHGLRLPVPNAPWALLNRTYGRD